LQQYLYAYVGTGQVVNMPQNENTSYDLLLKRVRAIGQEKEIKLLEQIGKPPYKDVNTWMIKGRFVVMYAPPSASGRSLPNVFTPDLIPAGLVPRSLLRKFADCDDLHTPQLAAALLNFWFYIQFAPYSVVLRADLHRTSIPLANPASLPPSLPA
jgi:hypothetical protein